MLCLIHYPRAHTLRTKKVYVMFVVTLAHTLRTRKVYVCCHSCVHALRTRTVYVLFVILLSHTHFTDKEGVCCVCCHSCAQEGRKVRVCFASWVKEQGGEHV